jgi:hypothetical protein
LEFLPGEKGACDWGNCGILVRLDSFTWNKRLCKRYLTFDSLFFIIV